MKLSESDLLEKWLSDDSFINWARNANGEHFQQWESYFEQHPEQIELAEMGKYALLNLNKKEHLVDPMRSQLALERLKNTMTQKVLRKKQKTKVVPFFKRWQAAAAILLLLGMSFWGYYQNSSASNQVLIATNFGETKEITLEDQSKVVLNANSTLAYNRQSPRKVRLEGEAFFEVAKKPATGEQFQVITNDLTVEVLGTIFNVKNRAGQTKVFLKEGKVVLDVAKKEGGKIEMVPGELISYSKNEQKIIEKRKANALENTSWKDGIIRFKETPLSEVLSEISTIYGVKFELADPLNGNQLFSGGIPTQNKDIMLTTLTEVFSVEITQKEGNYFISQNKMAK